MVQAIENRARVTCHAIGPPRPGPAADWSTYTVRIDRVEAVPGWPNLLADAVGREVTAAVPPRLVPLLSARSEWTVEVEVVGPRRITIKDLATGTADGGRGAGDGPERAAERPPRESPGDS